MTPDFPDGQPRSSPVNERLSLDRVRPKSPLSDRFRDSFHIHSFGRPRSRSSAHVPVNLPSLEKGAGEDQWEHRAALLASGGQPSSVNGVGHLGGHLGAEDSGGRKRSTSVVSTVDTDDNIQEAIRLHEAGELARSTRMFGKLAEQNNPLSQVLYGLALRHGWGIDVDLPKALTYLQAAARNSAAVEEQALAAGMKKGGSAKGELVLAIFELGNCFRHAWGVEKDPVAAREYYETAANLGDADAQNEVAWCYLEGFGCKKDKVSI
ncbi:uncharacterized protein H6S33_002166 [Morchella sextelata]|uniref:uncharacterized protein n=1 Tax=Morchella sextelata TaxID=1174677 RepID=UPI001D0501A6|nr:uncharacterized protein H6S33_002166 [Morchella sextelata]KAH0608114.1 hypothetical protein H6S33_002166 [Morchella sextelata]